MRFRQRLQRLREDDRLQRILHGGASGLIASGAGLLVSVVSVPLVFHYLGVLEYGVWITISTTVVMLSVLDLGIANTLTNFIAEAYADNDSKRAQHYFATAFWISILLASTLALIASCVWLRLDWGHVFHLSDPTEIHHARSAVAISAAYFLCSLPLNLAGKVLAGYQEVHQVNYFGMVNNLFGLAAVISVIHFRGNLIHLMAAYCSAMLFGTLCLNVWLCIYRRPWLFPAPKMVRLQMTRTLFGEGMLFFVLQLTGIVVYNSDNLVIAHYLGADPVSPYSIAWKLVNTASLLHSILLPSLWAAFTAAYHRGELSWIRKTYRVMRQRTITAVAIMACIWALTGRWVIRAWAGPGAVPASRLLWLMATYVVLYNITTNQAILLTATRRLKLEASVAVLAAIVNVVLTIRWVKSYGPEGVILGTITSFGVCMVLPQAWEVGRVLRGVYIHQRASEPLVTGR